MPRKKKNKQAKVNKRGPVVNSSRALAQPIVKSEISSLRREIRNVADSYAKREIKTKVNELTRTLDQPFAGHDNAAVFWLRRYLNPCDDVSLAESGIPDKETAPAARFGVVQNVTYSPKDTFLDCQYYTYMISDTQMSMIQVHIKRKAYECTRFYVFPNYFTPILIVESGTYEVDYIVDGAKQFTRTIKNVAQWASTQQNSEEVYGLGNTNLMKGSPLYKNGIVYYRNNFFGITLSNKGKPLDKNGCIYATYFNLDSEVTPTTTAGDASTNSMNYYGVPIDEADFNSRNNDSAVLTAKQGVYGVLYNWHPDFKYQRMRDSYLINRQDIRNETDRMSNTVTAVNLLSDVVPHTGQNPAKLVGQDAHFAINAAPSLNDQAEEYYDTLYVWRKSVNTGDPVCFQLPYFANDSWSWKCLGILYTGDESGLQANIKICAEYSAMIAPSSPLIANVIRPPAYDEAIMEFATLFVHARIMIYPSSFNSWNKIWQKMKDFYKNNKCWINPLLKNGLSALAGCL